MRRKWPPTSAGPCCATCWPRQNSDLAAARCCSYTTHHLQTLNSRALARGEAAFSVDEAIDILIAPICYRILFSNGETSPDYVNALLTRFAHLNDGST